MDTPTPTATSMAPVDPMASGGFMPPPDSPPVKAAVRLQPEAAIWCAVIWLVLFARLASRRLALGTWRRLQLEDSLAIIAVMIATALTAIMDELVRLDTWAPVFFLADEGFINRKIHFNKLVMVAEHLQILTVWLMKAALLLMYKRLTSLLASERQVLLTSAYCVITFVVMEVCYFAVWCRPFPQYWAVVQTDPNSQCGTVRNHLIFSLVFNVSSDILIMAIPLPLLYRVQLPMKKKVVLGGLIMLGCCAIIMAVVGKVYSFQNGNSIGFTIWYLRESYTAILCANLPLIHPLIQRIARFGNRGHTSFSSSNKSNQSRSYSGSFKLGDQFPNLQATPRTREISTKRGDGTETLTKIETPMQAKTTSTNNFDSARNLLNRDLEAQKV